MALRARSGGVRRYRNTDGTLTPEGKKRYGKESSSKIHKRHIDYPEGPVDVFRVTRGKTSAANGKKIDDLAKNMDYSGTDEFDNIGCRALKVYKSKGPEAAFEYVSKNLKGYEFDYFIQDEEILEWGDKYETFQLAVHGKDKVYVAYGEDDYIGENFFEDRKRYVDARRKINW